MMFGLYSGASAMNFLERQQELTSSNIANLQTNGFRRASLSIEERFSEEGRSQPGARVRSEVVDFSTSTSSLKPSGNPLDVALSGDGFFTVSDGQQTYYTRAGNFHRDSTGAMVNGDGMAVMGTGGPIAIDPNIGNGEISIDEAGAISARGQQLGQLSVAAFKDNHQLIPNGQVYFASSPGQATETFSGSVLQGSQEMSNSHAVTELVSLIITSRLFEAAQRTIRTIGETVQQNYRE
jgi:flagellar basal body rod protein FlgG